MEEQRLDQIMTVVLSATPVSDMEPTEIQGKVQQLEARFTSSTSAAFGILVIHFCSRQLPSSIKF